MEWVVAALAALKSITASMGVVGKIVGALHDWAIYKAGQTSQANADKDTVNTDLTAGDQIEQDISKMSDADVKKELEKS